MRIFIKTLNMTNLLKYPYTLYHCTTWANPNLLFHPLTKHDMPRRQIPLLHHFDMFEFCKYFLSLKLSISSSQGFYKKKVF